MRGVQIVLNVLFSCLLMLSSCSFCEQQQEEYVYGDEKEKEKTKEKKKEKKDKCIFGFYICECVWRVCKSV